MLRTAAPAFIVSSPSGQPPLGQTPAFLTGAVAAADDVVVEEIQVAGKAYRRMFPDVESGGKVAFSGIDQHSVLLQHVLAMLTMRETQLLLQAESAGGAPLAFGALWKQHVGKPKKTNPPCFFQPTDHEAHPRTDATSMKLPFIGSRVCVGFQANGDDVVVDKGTHEATSSGPLLRRCPDPATTGFTTTSAHHHSNAK